MKMPGIPQSGMAAAILGGHEVALAKARLDEERKRRRQQLGLDIGGLALQGAGLGVGLMDKLNQDKRAREELALREQMMHARSREAEEGRNLEERLAAGNRAQAFKLHDLRELGEDRRLDKDLSFRREAPGLAADARIREARETLPIELERTRSELEAQADSKWNLFQRMSPVEQQNALELLQARAGEERLTQEEADRRRLAAEQEMFRLGQRGKEDLLRMGFDLEEPGRAEERQIQKEHYAAQRESAADKPWMTAYAAQALGTNQAARENPRIPASLRPSSTAGPDEDPAMQATRAASVRLAERFNDPKDAWAKQTREGLDSWTGDDFTNRALDLAIQQAIESQGDPAVMNAVAEELERVTQQRGLPWPTAGQVRKPKGPILPYPGQLLGPSESDVSMYRQRISDQALKAAILERLKKRAEAFPANPIMTPETLSPEELDLYHRAIKGR